jgi:prepilin-type N-terminal cleavage/methylation domain-containing protein
VCPDQIIHSSFVIRHSSFTRRAFTLIEMVVALSIFVLLIGGIFAIANGTLELSSDLTYAQERALMRQNLIDFLRKSFRTLPGDASIELKVQSVGSTYMPSLAIYSGGTSFSPGPAISPEASIEVYTEERPGGYLRVGLRGLDADQTLAARQGKSVKSTDKTAELPLLDNVSRFEWRFYEPRSNQWMNYWKEQQGRPLFAELSLALDDAQEVRAVFWIPPVVRGAQMGIPNPPQQPGAPEGTNQATPGVPNQVQPLPGGGGTVK